jgi:two-component sensor histidine kinase
MDAIKPSITNRYLRQFKIITLSLDNIVSLITRVIPRSGAALAIYSLLCNHRYVQGCRGVTAGNMLSEETGLNGSGKRLIAINGPAGIVAGKLAIAAKGLEKHDEFLKHIVLILSQAVEKIEDIEIRLQKYSDPEFFLREMRHRHRNLLQFICGSLSTLIAPLPELDPQIREKIEQWFDELLLLYTMLEDSPDDKNVRILAYFSSFFRQIQRTILARIGTLSAVYGLDEALEIPRARATLLAILLLELSLNTVKHRETGSVSIQIRIYREGKNFILHYSDHNTPPDEEKAEKKGSAVSESMGLEIIKQLTARAGGKRLDDASSVHIFRAAFSLA